MATFSQFSGDIGVNAIARAISAFADQEYTDAVRIAGTALIGADSRISTSDEDYFGTIRWQQTLGALEYNAAAGTNSRTATNVNYATEDSTEGALTDTSYDSAIYIKTVRTHGARNYNTTQVLTQREGAIEKISRDFGVTRARDADEALLHMMRGVAQAEVNRQIDGAAAIGATNRYGQGYTDSTYLNADAGFYYDVNGPFNTGNTNNAAARTNRLIDPSGMGGGAASALWRAAGAFGDLEPDFFYLIVTPETYQDIRAANLLDNQDRISDGNVELDTLLQGKFRLIVTRSLARDGFGMNATTAAAANDPVNNGSGRTSYLMLPGALYQHDVPVTNPVAFDNDESVGRGSGDRELWYRWGNVWHPRGYTWTGLTNTFATNGTLNAPFSAASNSGYANGGQWERKETPGNLGILPIFHA